MPFKFNQNGDLFNGLFTYLFKTYPENPFSPFIQVNVSSSYANRADPLYVFVPEKNKNTTSQIWLSQSIPNSNYTITFKKNPFKLTSYSVRSRGDQSYNIPLEWILQGSNDLMNWVDVHHKERNNELIGGGKEKNYICQNQKFFCSYRFTQIGKNYYTVESQKYIFSIATIEFFGAFVDTYCTECRLKCFSFNPIHFLSITFLLSSQ